MGSQSKAARDFLATTRKFLRQHWQRALRVREKFFLTEEAIHLLIAGGVGVLGGVINKVYYLSIEQTQALFVGDSTKNIVEVAEVLRKSNPVLMAFIPAMGALVAGLVLYWGLRFAGKARTTNLLEVVVAGDGRLPFRSGLVRGISSIISIGSGASIGREGGITQLSATAASKWGQLAKWQPYRLRLLVACGAAAGMAAAYDAPITGAVFAAHIVLGNFSMQLFLPLLCASAVAATMSREFFGIHPWYNVPNFDFNSISQLPWFLVLGVFCGIIGAAFLKLLRVSEELFKKIPLLPLRMVVGGLLMGGIAVLYPQVCGNGFLETSRIIQQKVPAEMLLQVFLAKILATGVTVGAGAVGGVITPTLFIGAGVGGLFGMQLEQFGLAPAHMPVGIFALVGMGSVFAATTRSPLLAMFMIFEISLNYSFMTALMLGCAVATIVSQRLHPNSVYTEPIKLRSLEVDEYRLGNATDQTIGEMMREPVPPLRDNATLPQIGERFLRSQYNFFPVVDADQRLIGIVALQDLKEYLDAGQELNAVIATDVMRMVPPCLRPGQRLLDALPTLLASEQRNVPVVNTFQEMKLIGSVPRAEALAALSEAIASSTTTTSSTEITAKNTTSVLTKTPKAKS